VSGAQRGQAVLHREPDVTVSAIAPSTAFGIGVVALVVTSFGYRLWLVSQWSWYGDDFGFAQTTETFGFWHYVFQDYHGHVMPLQFLVMWVITSVDPLGHAWVTGLIALLAAGTTLTWALALRELFGERIQVLVGLVILTGTPCMVGTSLWWATSLPAYGLQLFMGLCVWFLARWLLSGGAPRDLLLLTAAYSGALLFWQKSLLITIPLLFMVLVVAEGPLRTRMRVAIRALWRVAAITVAYLIGYAMILRADSLGGESDGPRGRSLGQVTDFYWHALTDLALPSLVGGPIDTLPSADATYPVSPTALTWILIGAALLVVALSLRHRRGAAPALAMATTYAALGWALVLFNYRYDLFGVVLAASPRYWSDSLAVAVLAVTFLVTPTRGRPTESSFPRLPPGERLRRLGRATLVPALLLLLVAVIVGNVRAWSAMRDSSPAPWFETLTADAQQVGKASVYNSQGPVSVVGLIASDGQRVANVLAPMDLPVRFDAPAPELLVVDDAGHLTLGQVFASTKAKPGPVPGCGYAVSSDGPPVLIPLEGELFPYEWVMDLTYFTEKDAIVSLEVDGKTTEVPMPAGAPGTVAHVLVVIRGEVRDVTVETVQSTSTICVTEVGVGEIKPTEQQPEVLRTGGAG
jgi:hypothetical protein